MVLLLDIRVEKKWKVGVKQPVINFMWYLLEKR